jgi:hypothetical protein
MIKKIKQILLSWTTCCIIWVIISWAGLKDRPSSDHFQFQPFPISFLPNSKFLPTSTNPQRLYGNGSVEPARHGRRRPRFRRTLGRRRLCRRAGLPRPLRPRRRGTPRGGAAARPPVQVSAACLRLLRNAAAAASADAPVSTPAPGSRLALRYTRRRGGRQEPARSRR